MRTQAPVQARGHARHVDEYGLVGESPGIRSLRDAILRVAPSPGILVVGEAGTGKELVARALHAAAGERGPFVAVRCATAPRHLAGAEVFGRGATGSPGPPATEGTLFLRDVGELGMDVQARLVHALDAGAPGRVVASSRRAPEEAVAEGRLREDLLARLGAVTLVVPPLRERREDVPLLVEHFLASFCSRRCGCVTGLSPAALEALAEADWPENVRELRRVVEEAVVDGSEPTIGLSCLPERLRRGRGECVDEPPALPTLAEAEANLVRLALSHHRGNKLAAARTLGISRHKLYDVLRRIGEQ